MLAGRMERLLWVFVLGVLLLFFFFLAWSEWEGGREREEEAVSEYKAVTT